jgi:hypothetical protein
MDEEIIYPDPYSLLDLGRDDAERELMRKIIDAEQKALSNDYHQEDSKE